MLCTLIIRSVFWSAASTSCAPSYLGDEYASVIGFRGCPGCQAYLTSEPTPASAITITSFYRKISSCFLLNAKPCLRKCKHMLLSIKTSSVLLLMVRFAYIGHLEVAVLNNFITSFKLIVVCLIYALMIHGYMRVSNFFTINQLYPPYLFSVLYCMTFLDLFVF